MSDITLVNSVFPSSSAMPPYGLLYLTAVLEQNGFTVDLRDYQLVEHEDPWEWSTFLHFIEGSADIIGVSAYSFSLPFLIKAFSHLKEEHPEKKIILGGIGAAGVHEELITQFSCIDIVVRGEGERTLPPLLRALTEKDSLKRINGITYRDEGSVLVNPPQKRIENMDELPFPSYEKIDFSRYLVPAIMYSRGCPFPCTFCDLAPYWDRKNTRRSLQNFLEEINLLTEQYGQKRITIVDDTFVLQKKRVLAFCEAMIEEDLDLEWGCYGRVDLVDAETLSAMARAGCKKIYYGIESGNNEVLKTMEKGFTIEQALKAIDVSLDHIPVIQTAFVWGFPFENVDQLHDTLFTMMHLIRKGTAVKAALLTPFPLSSIYHRYKDTIAFSEDMISNLYMAGFHDKPEIIEMIKKHKNIFCSFYYYDSPFIREKYELVKMMGLSSEDIWDTWERSKWDGYVDTKGSPG
ncbi:MAG: radical SAM protein [Theionarchaea archaeon]|nr:radical SAM protein [Theionarchaea archaeon]